MKTPVWGTILICILSIVSLDDYEEEQRELKHYCGMVDEGRWPNYNNVVLEDMCES